MPPQPHFPTGLSPAIGYLATREATPLGERDELAPEEWSYEDLDQEWPSGHSRVVKVTAIIVSFSLIVAGLGTVVELVLTAR
ncbi:MAG TPA: hypothetical protein VHV57_15410 [Acidimicrobiales bacterium]|nr:hypothetical protein [Acidimicrobiales bacterium]